MKIRLSGTREECMDFAAVLPDLLGEHARVESVSRFYPDRDASYFGRLYLDLVPLAPPPAGRPSATTSTIRTTHGGAR